MKDHIGQLFYINSNIESSDTAFSPRNEVFRLEARSLTLLLSSGAEHDYIMRRSIPPVNLIIHPHYFRTVLCKRIHDLLAC